MLSLPLAWAVPAAADTLFLADGSVINGSLQTLRDGVYRIRSDFAGDLEIPKDKVTGVDTDEPHTVVLADGDELGAWLRYDGDAGRQHLISEGFGARELTPAAIAGIRDLGAPDPALAELSKDPWSGRLALGLAGSSGNSDSRSINARGEALRKTDGERLSFSLRVFRQQDDGEKTADETIGRARLERDFSERFFLFGETEVENDELEDIDLRFRATLGPGYFLIREPDHELKGRLGLGYEYEAYVSGGNDSSAVATLGYDYMVELRKWFRFNHELTLISTIDDQPSENYRVDSLLGGEFPLGDGSLWRLRAEYRHRYDNNPEPGIEELDTTYLLNLVRDFE